MATAQGRTTIRRKPRQGDPGIAGCIHRQTVWAAGIEYRNDEAETTGTRFLDIVLVMTGVNTFNAFKCIKTHISTAAHLNTSTNVLSATYWQPFNQMLPVYTPFLLAPNAKISFLSGNEIQIMGANGTTVKALISGNGTGSSGIRFAAGVDISNLLSSKWYVDENGYMRSTSGKIAEFVISGNSLISTYDETGGTAYPMITLNWAGNSYDKKGYIPMRGEIDQGLYPVEYRDGGAFNVVENKRNLRNTDFTPYNIRAAQAAYVVKSNRDMTGLNRDYGYVTNDINWSKRNFEQHSVACAVYDPDTDWHIDALKDETTGIWDDVTKHANGDYDLLPEIFDFVYSSNWLIRNDVNTELSLKLPHKNDLLRFINNSVSVFLHGEEPNLWHINNRLSFVFKIIAMHGSYPIRINPPAPYPATAWYNESGDPIITYITLTQGNSLEILFCNGSYQLIKRNV